MQLNRQVTKGERASGQRGSAAVRAILWILVGALVALFLVADPLAVSPVDGWLGLTRAAQIGQGGGLWTCGMHPEVIRDEPGICPICHMDLVPVKGEPDAGEVAQIEHVWTCPMHPMIVESEPGTCPICGMDLVETAAGGEGTAEPADREILFYRSPMDPNVTSDVPRQDEMGMDFVPVYRDAAEAAAVEGAVVTIDPVVQQNMNVVIETVERKDITNEIRTVGYVGYDQERMVSVTTKYPGFIEKTYVNYIGQPVTRGEPLFEIYSPELVQTERELLAALRYADGLASAPADTRDRARALVEAARQRLAYWDISPRQINSLEETGEVFRTLQVVAPASGVVMKRISGLEGTATQPGMELLHIADLSNLWLTVEVFDHQLPWIDLGSRATVTLSYLPGVTYRGRVRFIEPEVSQTTRTVQLTLDVPNRDGRLRVGMYATVVFEPVVAADAVAVPAEAVLRTGERNLVVVALGKGEFAPREVVLGASGRGFVQVLDGLEEGDRLVTSAQFLIDSESSLREAIRKMIAERRGGGGS